MVELGKFLKPIIGDAGSDFFNQVNKQNVLLTILLNRYWRKFVVFNKIAMCVLNVFMCVSCVFHVFFMTHCCCFFLNCSISLNALCFCWMVHSSAVPYSYQYTNYRYNNYQYNNYQRNRLWSWFTGVDKITFSNTKFFGFQVDRKGCGVFFLFF